MDVDGLRVMKKNRKEHVYGRDLPAKGTAYLDDRTVVSGTGDKIVHIASGRRKPLFKFGSCGSCCNIYVLLTFFAVMCFAVFTGLATITGGPWVVRISKM